MQAVEIPAAVEVVPTETPQALVEAVPAPVVSDAPAAPAVEVAAEQPALTGGKRSHKKTYTSRSLSKTGKKKCPAGLHRVRHYSKATQKMVVTTPIRCSRFRNAVPRHLKAMRFSGGEGEQQLEGGSRRRRRSRSRSRR
jgi:hypothetical protein